MNRDKGFTLPELMIVVVIIGILASIAYPRYIRIAEKGRAAEAKDALGRIRNAELGYRFEFDTYTSDFTALQTDFPTSCTPNFYFFYVIDSATAGSFSARATRCTSGGKDPQAPQGSYNVTITDTGALGGTQAYL